MDFGASLGGFLVGFDATVISGAVPFIRDYFGLGGDSGSLKLGWAVSCLGWGAMAGNLAAGVLSDRFGRKKVLLLTSLLFLASALTAASSTSFTVFVIARICGGLAVGAAILTALALKAVFRLALRQTEGLIGSVIRLFDLTLAVPDHSTLSRRAETLDVPRPKRKSRTARKVSA